MHLCYAFASQGITSGTNETIAQSCPFAFGANFACPLPSQTADHRNILSVAALSGRVGARSRGSCLTTVSGRKLPYGKRLRSILAPAFNRPILVIPLQQRQCGAGSCADRERQSSAAPFRTPSCSRDRPRHRHDTRLAGQARSAKSMMLIPGAPRRSLPRRSCACSSWRQRRAALPRRLPSSLL